MHQADFIDRYIRRIDLRTGIAIERSDLSHYAIRADFLHRLGRNAIIGIAILLILGIHVIVAADGCRGRIVAVINGLHRHRIRRGALEHQLGQRAGRNDNIPVQFFRSSNAVAIRIILIAAIIDYMVFAILKGN